MKKESIKYEKRKYDEKDLIIISIVLVTFILSASIIKIQVENYKYNYQEEIKSYPVSNIPIQTKDGGYVPMYDPKTLNNAKILIALGDKK